MFIFTQDRDKPKRCFCEIVATAQGSCDSHDLMHFNLYRHANLPGSLLCYSYNFLCLSSVKLYIYANGIPNIKQNTT